MRRYSNPYELINDIAPVILNITTETEQDYLRHVLDFESMELCLHDGAVDIVDMISGEIYNTQPLFQFMRESIKFAMHDCEEEDS